MSTPESSRLLNLVLFWCFGKHYFLWNHEISFINFWTFSVGGCWGQPKLIFWKLVLTIKMSTGQDFKTTFKHNLTCIFLSLKLKKPFCPRTPCTNKLVVASKLSTEVPLEYDILQDMLPTLLWNRLVLLHHFSDIFCPGIAVSIRIFGKIDFMIA